MSLSRQYWVQSVLVRGSMHPDGGGWTQEIHAAKKPYRRDDSVIFMRQITRWQETLRR
jgi:hypothetical protein